MKFGINTLDDFDLKGKTVLCRVDINEPVDKTTDTLKDITRIQGCAPTLMELSDKGAKTVIMAHQGSDIEYKNFYTTRPHAKVLSELLGREVKFIPDVCGPAAIEAIKALKEGELLLLDNVRFMAEEQTLFEQRLKLSHEDQARTMLVSRLAPLGDLYVCDAFAAAHRDQPTLCGFEQLLPSAMGRLFEKEYVTVSSLIEQPEHPCVFVLGGAKAGDAFGMMETVLESGAADKILTGGVVANVCLAAKGFNTGSGSVDFIEKHGFNENIAQMSALMEKYPGRIIVPSDLMYVKNSERCETACGSIPDDACIIDIGHNTAKEYSEIIMEARTVFVNGPMGVFEDEISAYGTKTVWDALGDTEAMTVLGGGDSITATKKFDKTDMIKHISTGGGALIRFLSGEDLPVVRALRGACHPERTQ